MLRWGSRAIGALESRSAAETRTDLSAVLEEGQDAGHAIDRTAAALELQGRGANERAGVAEQRRGAIGNPIC